MAFGDCKGGGREGGSGGGGGGDKTSVPDGGDAAVVGGDGAVFPGEGGEGSKVFDGGGGVFDGGGGGCMPKITAQRRLSGSPGRGFGGCTVLQKPGLGFGRADELGAQGSAGFAPSNTGSMSMSSANGS